LFQANPINGHKPFYDVLNTYYPYIAERLHLYLTRAKLWSIVVIGRTAENNDSLAFYEY